MTNYIVLNPTRINGIPLIKSEGPLDLHKHLKFLGFENETAVIVGDEIIKGETCLLQVGEGPTTLENFPRMLLGPEGESAFIPNWNSFVQLSMKFPEVPIRKLPVGAVYLVEIIELNPDLDIIKIT